MDGPNIMYRGAKAIALRVLGADTPRNRRVVFKWASEIPADERPFPIHKDGRSIYSWESDIADAAQHNAAVAAEGTEEEEFSGEPENHFPATRSRAAVTGTSRRIRKSRSPARAADAG